MAYAQDAIPPARRRVALRTVAADAALPDGGAGRASCGARRGAELPRDPAQALASSPADRRLHARAGRSGDPGRLADALLLRLGGARAGRRAEPAPAQRRIDRRRRQPRRRARPERRLRPAVAQHRQAGDRPAQAPPGSRVQSRARPAFPVGAPQPDAVRADAAHCLDGPSDVVDQEGRADQGPVQRRRSHHRCAAVAHRRLDPRPIARLERQGRIAQSADRVGRRQRAGRALSRLPAPRQDRVDGPGRQVPDGPGHRAARRGAQVRPGRRGLSPRARSLQERRLAAAASPASSSPNSTPSFSPPRPPRRRPIRGSRKPRRCARAASTAKACPKCCARPSSAG